MNKKALTTGFISAVLAGTMLAGCGTQNSVNPGNGTNSTGNSTAVTNTTSNATGNATGNQTGNNTGNNTTTGTNGGSKGSSLKSAQPPGPNGPSMQKVVNAVFTDKQVRSFMDGLHAPASTQWGAAFVTADKSGNPAPKDGKWTLQLLEANKAVANIIVTDGTFKVESITKTDGK